MRALALGLARRHHYVRGYAQLATDLVPQEDSPFLRFGNPDPQTYNHLQALSQIPDTKVQSSAEVWRCWAHSSQPSPGMLHSAAGRAPHSCKAVTSTQAHVEDGVALSGSLCSYASAACVSGHAISTCQAIFWSWQLCRMSGAGSH